MAVSAIYEQRAMASPKPVAYRLVACDLDGTLIGDDATLPSQVRQALEALQTRGIYVTIATGRGFLETLPFARSLKITIPIICYQGGLIKHPVTNELLFRATMERALVLDVAKLARAHDWHLVIYIDDTVLVQEFRHPRRFYQDLVGLNIQCVDDLAQAIHDTKSDPAKFLFVADEAESDLIHSELETRLGEQLQIVRSHALFVEGNPLGVNKGDALRRLSAYLNVTQAQVMAIGDQGNDAPMLEWAGLGVAMGNASPETQAAADWLAPPLSENGAVVAIERFLLSAESV
jgi:Cof subfamily protein (haloacid dehalogenase superfamily)